MLNLFTQITEDEGDDLCTGAAVSGAEGSCACAGGDVFGNRPQNCVGIVIIDIHIAKGVSCSYSELTCRTPQQGNGLTAGYGILGAKDSCAGTHRDALFRCPQDGLVVISALCHVSERTVRGRRLGTAHGPPQECHGLGAGADATRVKRGCGYSRGNALVQSPEYRVIVICISGNVGEWHSPLYRPLGKDGGICCQLHAGDSGGYRWRG